MRRAYLIIAVLIICILQLHSVDATTKYYNAASSTRLQPATDVAIGLMGTFTMQCRVTTGTAFASGTPFNWDMYLQYNKSTAPAWQSIPTSGSTNLVTTGSNPESMLAQDKASTNYDFSSHTVTAYTARTYSVRCTVYDNNLATYFYSLDMNITVLGPDTVAPNVSLNAPVNESWNNTGNVVFHYTPDDNLDSLANCSVILNSVLNNTNLSAITEEVDNSIAVNGLSDSGYYWNVNCTDTDNNVGTNTSLKYVSVDTASPTIQDPYVNETSIDQNEYFCINITVTDVTSGVQASTVKAEVWDTTSWVNYSMVDDGSTSCDGGSGDGFYGVDIQATASGDWLYSKVYANDTANNPTYLDFADKTISVVSAETIDVTLHEVPIDFGNLDSNSANQSAQVGNGFPINITIESTTNVAINITFKAGSPTFSDGGSNSFLVGNLTYSNNSDSDTGIRITTSCPNIPVYSDWMDIPAPASATNRSAYFWVTIPSGQVPATYKANVTIMVTNDLEQV